MVLVFADGRYTERINAGCLLMGQSVFMIEVSKGGQGGTPLPTTSLQTKSESVIVGYYTSAEVPSPRRRQPGVPFVRAFCAANLHRPQAM